MVTGSVKGRFKQLEMNGRHLRAEYRISLAHFFGKNSPFKGGRFDFARLLTLLAHADSGQQRADADAGSAKVVYFIYFQAGINFIRAG